MEEYINTEIKGNYAEIEFFHPSHNSLHSRMLESLILAIEKLEDVETVTAIILKSGGDRTFCAGANFDEMKSIVSFDQGMEFFSGFGRVILAMKNSSKLIIGRIQGKAVGGGVGLISACDIAFATKYASIRLSELSIGIGPFVIAPAVERKIGLASFSELTLNPKAWKDAFWCKGKGLYSEVFDSTVQLDQYVETYAKEISSYNKNAIIENKKVLWDGVKDLDKLMLARAAITGKLVLNLKL